jgi:hypothetical protein
MDPLFSTARRVHSFATDASAFLGHRRFITKTTIVTASIETVNSQKQSNTPVPMPAGGAGSSVPATSERH